MAVGLPRGCGHSQQPDEPGQVVLISRRGQGVHASIEEPLLPVPRRRQFSSGRCPSCGQDTS